MEKKYTIEECCEQFILDPVLKQGMTHLLLLLQNLKMKPIWYHKTSYKCNYKGERVVYINMGRENWLRIRVCTVNNMHGTGNMDLYMQTLPDDMRAEYENYLANFQECKVCKGCNGICERRRSYYITNPTQEQFFWIEKFIFARREFIDNPIL